MNPRDLITPGATWQMGAWTPARCALWETLTPERQVKMVDWVMREKEQGKCYPEQLPDNVC